MTTPLGPPHDRTDVSPRTLHRLILPLLAFCTFSVIFNNLIIGPVLRDIADDLDVPVGTAGLLITAYALTAGLVAFFAAPLIDRLGRRRVIIMSITTLAAATFASALAPNYWTLLLCRAAAGVGVAGLQPAVFAAVGDYFPYSERGRAMGWVVTANTTAGIIGVPAGAFLADAFSWRITFVMLGIITAAVAFVFATRFPKREAPLAAERTSYRADYMPVFRNHFARMLILSNTLVTLSVFGWVTYFGAFLIDEFGLSTGQVGIVSAIGSFGVLIGSTGGGRLADRFGKKPVIVVAGFQTGLFVLLVPNVIIAVWFAALLYFLWAMPGGARMSGATALTTAVLPEKRGTLMAINAAGQQFGIMTGAALGGLVVSAGGYGALGLFASVTTLASTLLVLRFVDEKAAVGSQPTPVHAL